MALVKAQKNTLKSDKTLVVVIGIVPIIIAGVSGKSLFSATESSTGCGPTALGVVYESLTGNSHTAVYGLFNPPEAETSFSSLSIACQQLNLKANAWKMSVNRLRLEKPTGIIHLSSNHFVAITGYRSGQFLISNPARFDAVQEEVWSEAKLKRLWTGEILVISK